MNVKYRAHVSNWGANPEPELIVPEWPLEVNRLVFNG